MIVQCEDLYELISCLLPEVTASPAQHCTYSIFGTTFHPAWVRNSVFAIFFLLSFFCHLCLTVDFSATLSKQSILSVTTVTFASFL